ncbi:MAG: hypothetical protein AAGF81_03440 [Pseudomonadota bacterium]
MTDIEHLTAADVSRLNDHYIREAKKLRAKEMARIFGGILPRVFSAVAGIFNRPQTLAGSAR